MRVQASWSIFKAQIDFHDDEFDDDNDDEDEDDDGDEVEGEGELI